MRTFRIEVCLEDRQETLTLKSMESEPNLWKVVLVKEGFQEDEEEWISNGRVLGLVMTYVDDIFVTGIEKVVSAVVAKLRDTWKTSEPEWVGRDPVRFLGLEVTCHQAEGGIKFSGVCHKRPTSRT